jgi:hypothetical protein
MRVGDGGRLGGGWLPTGWLRGRHDELVHDGQLSTTAGRLLSLRRQQRWIEWMQLLHVRWLGEFLASYASPFLACPPRQTVSCTTLIWIHGRPLALSRLVMLSISFDPHQFVSTVGVSEVIYMLKSYDANFVSYDDGYSYDQLPTCDQGQNGYLGMDCTDGQFTINYFSDQYCMARTGQTYDKLSNINKMMSTYSSCTTSSSDGGSSLVSNLVYYSSSCTSADYEVCSDDYNFDMRSNGVSSATKSWTSGLASGGHQTWVTKLKYVIGGLFLLASFIMFTGILFTNRRRRRAMMMRKYRQAKKAKKDKGRDSSSRKSRSGSKRRSKSKSRDKASDGVFT